MEIMDLKDFCNKYLLDEKLFIVSTRAIGMQMINRMAREGHPSINLRAVTLQRLAFEILEEYIVNNQKLIIDHILGNNLIIDILKDLARENPDGFFKPNLIDAKTAEEVYRVITELKYNGLESFPEVKDLDKIYSKYEERLEELNAMDYCDIIIEASRSSNLKTYQDKRIAIASNIEFHNLDEIFFKKLIENNCIRINMPVKSIEGCPKNYYYKENQIPMEIENKNIEFYQGYGTTEEIGIIIENIKKKEIPLDEVVIAYTNSKYANLINIEFEKEDIPITFGGGLGIESSTVYRFINTIFTWAKNYYNVNEIRPIFANGDIKIDTKYIKSNNGISAPAIYEELVACKIISGKENYNRVLKLDEEGNESIEKDNNLNKYQIQRRIWLREFFIDLFQAIPIGGYIRFSEYIPKLTNLITKYVKNLNKYDGAARHVVLQTLDKIENINLDISRYEYFDIILSYIKSGKILRSQPQPGHVYATSFRNAGYTGRKYLYLIGLDSDSLSNKVIESPILLDLMKAKISDKLPIANESYEYKKYKIRELLTADFENISIGYSNFDTVDVKVKSPSQIYNELKDMIGENHLEEYEENERIIKGRDLVKSATALEILAECPRKFYLKYKMGLSPKEDVDIRVDRWLDGIAKGNIIHEVLNIYFDLQENEQTKETLVELVDNACEKAKKDIVYFLEEVYLREKENLLDACENIVDITRNDKEWNVLVNELSFGTQGKVNKVFGKLPNQKINIAGLELDVSGAIDRVDINKKDNNLFRIVDYKTGNMDNFNKKLRISSGRGKSKVYDYSETQKLQYYIYKKALDKILENEKERYPDAKIEKFTYIFEGHEKSGIIDLEFNDEFIDVIENRISNLLDGNLLELENQVIYDPEDELRCKYCDYSSICIVDKDLSIAEGVGSNE